MSKDLNIEIQEIICRLELLTLEQIEYKTSSCKFKLLFKQCNG